MEKILHILENASVYLRSEAVKQGAITEQGICKLEEELLFTRADIDAALPPPNW
jgi:hypothetical protein